MKLWFWGFFPPFTKVTWVLLNTDAVKNPYLEQTVSGCGSSAVSEDIQDLLLPGNSVADYRSSQAKLPHLRMQEPRLALHKHCATEEITSYMLKWSWKKWKTTGKKKFPLVRSSVTKNVSKLIFFIFYVDIDCFNSLEPLKIPNVLCLWAELKRKASWNRPLTIN